MKFENTDVWGFEHAIRGMPAKGYRKTKNNKYETCVSCDCKSINLGSYDTEKEAQKAVYDFRVNRFIRGCEKLNINPYDGREYEGKYIGFPSGIIMNLYGKEMIGSIGKDGYRHIIINKKNKNVHRIIGELFVENPNNFPIINHINGIKTDNRACNLEWCTYSYNTTHAYNNGLEQKQFGENHHSHKLTNDSVKYIKKVYQKGHPIFGAIALANKFNVDRTTILDVIRGKTWRNVI